MFVKKAYRKSKFNTAKKKRRPIINLRSLWTFFLVFFLFLWVIDFCFPLRHYNLIEQYARKYNLEPALICSIIHAESKFDNFAVSNKGASGLMQIRKMTADWAAKQMHLKDYSYEKIFSPEINIQIGCWYISNLIKQFGSCNSAICAYNAGSGNVAKWLSNNKFSADGVNLNYIPFKETRNYLYRVNRNKKIYKFLLGFCKNSSTETTKNLQPS